MLAVKGLDVLHQQAIAKSAEHAGSPALAMSTAAIAFLGAVALVILANGQVAATPDNPFASGAAQPFSSMGDAEAEAMADNIEAQADRLEAMADNAISERP